MMGIFGDLGGLSSHLFEPHGGSQAVLSQVLEEMGGVQGAMGKLQKAGLGEQVSSWLGTGPNQPVTPDAVVDALGRSRLGEIAARLGIPQDKLSDMVAQALPGLIDRISPYGIAQPHLLQDGAAVASPLDPPS